MYVQSLLTHMNKRAFLKLSSAFVVSRALTGGSAWGQDAPIRNWAGNLEYGTSLVDRPASLEEVQQVVRRHARIKPLGTRHCFNRIADSTDRFVSLSRMQRVLALDEAAREVTVEGGITYGQLCPQLHERGFALHNLASLPHISVAGACATATHGSGVGNGNLATAVTGLEPALVQARRTGPQSSSILRMVGVGALLGIVGVGAAAAYVATRNGPDQPTATSTVSAAPEDPGKPKLEEARKLAEAGDLEGAHKAIGTIDPTSPSLKDPAVHEIEGKWADGVIAESEKHTDDPNKQVELLWKVATTPTVDDARRKKAADMIKTIDPTIEVPTETKPGGAAPAPPPRTAPTPKPTTTASVGPGQTDRKALDDPKGKIADLMGRLNSLNERELTMLIGLCFQEGNTACRNKAAKRLQELQAENK